MFRYRIFFKKKTDDSACKSCKHIEMEKENIDKVYECCQDIAEKEELRIVMIAELSKRFK